MSIEIIVNDNVDRELVSAAWESDCIMEIDVNNIN